KCSTCGLIRSLGWESARPARPPAILSWLDLAGRVSCPRVFSELVLRPRSSGSLAEPGPTPLRPLIAEWPKVGRKAKGWVMNTDSGVYGANYLKRATVARFEIGMNLPEDSIYPDTADSPLDGRNKYVMHFAKGALPPVEEFWVGDDI